MAAPNTKLPLFSKQETVRVACNFDRRIQQENEEIYKSKESDENDAERSMNLETETAHLTDKLNYSPKVKKVDCTLKYQTPV